jgi:hypothetical protein
MTQLKFVYFGCSWTYGKCINLYNTLSPTDINLDEERLLADQKAYRSVIAEHFDACQLNLSRPGSSNDRQFRYASERYIGVQRPNPFYRSFTPESKIVWPGDDTVEPQEHVLWFITSSARKEFYHAESKEYHNEVFASVNHTMGKLYSTEYYDHEYEVERLAQQMILWNEFFKNKNIKNIWVDTFNHHNYPIHIPNLVRFESGYNDLMTNMCLQLGYTANPIDDYKSEFNPPPPPDNSRSKYLVNLGYLNPKTLHPTIKGHEMIAEMLIPKVKLLFNL